MDPTTAICRNIYSSRKATFMSFRRLWVSVIDGYRWPWSCVLWSRALSNTIASLCIATLCCRSRTEEHLSLCCVISSYPDKLKELLESASSAADIPTLHICNYELTPKLRSSSSSPPKGLSTLQRVFLHPKLSFAICLCPVSSFWGF
jgi:hypothetical protein